MPIDERLEDDPDEDMDDPNERRSTRRLDARRQADGELSDSDDEGEGGRRNHASHKEADSPTTGRRFGAPVGIMSTGTTHGVGPSGTQPVAGAAAGAPAGQTAAAEQSDMDVDDGILLSQVAKNNATTPATVTNGAGPVPKDEGDRS